jgi:hypothetical protein
LLQHLVGQVDYYGGGKQYLVLQYCVRVFARAGYGEYASVPMCGLLASQCGVFRVRFVDAVHGLVHVCFLNFSGNFVAVD